MKILIVGSTGMLGNTLKEYFSTLKYHTKSLDREHLDLSQCNWSDLEHKVVESDCNILINCAGLIKQRKNVTTADFISVNGLLPHRLADICRQRDIRMIHVTTDCVFTGLVGDYTEDSLHDISDDYGRSKSIGEPESCTVIRTSIIGEEEKNKLSLLEWVKSHENDVLKGYINHYWNGVTCLQLGKIIRQIIDEELYWSGVRHIFTDDRLNKYSLLKMINEIYGLGNVVKEFTTEETVNRTLNSKHDIKMFNIPSLYKQIVETRDFHQAIKDKKLLE